MARFEIDCGDGQEWLAIEAGDAEDAAVEYARDHAADVLLCPGRMLSVRDSNGVVHAICVTYRVEVVVTVLRNRARR